MSEKISLKVQFKEAVEKMPAILEDARLAFFSRIAGAVLVAGCTSTHGVTVPPLVVQNPSVSPSARPS